MSRSRFLSATKVFISAAAVAVSGGCSDGSGDDDSCGPGNAPVAGLGASGDAVTLTFGELRGGLNNDCPAGDAPSGVVSLTIAGTQSDGTGLVTLCIGRPDRLAKQGLALGLDVASAEVRIVDIRGTAAGCSFTIDRSQSVTGTASSSGMCGNGGDVAGFALVIDGALSLTRTCGQTVDSIRIMLRGRVAVAPG